MKGRPLQSKEWKKLLQKNCPRDSKKLNVVSLLPLKLALMAGLRELEITLLPIDCLITPTGELNELFLLPEEIAHNGKERPVLLNPELRNDIEEYLKVLIEYHVNRMPHKAYMGFDPNARLIVNSLFKPYKTQSRGQLTSKPRIVPNELNQHLDGLIGNASLDSEGITRKSLLRTFVTEALKAKWPLDDIALLSGMSAANVKNIAVMDLDQYAPLSSFFTKRERGRELKIKRLEQVRRWTFTD